MTYKQIEASREARLWIRDVIVPASICIGTAITLHPELKDKAKDKLATIKAKLHR